MENHPIPQDITGFQFKLIGNMTVKQFSYLATGIVIGWFLFASHMSFIIKYPLALLSVGLGVSFAFVPLEGRPLDMMILNFIKAFFAPTQYVYQKTGGSLELNGTRSKEAKKAGEKVQNLPSLQSIAALDHKERVFTESISSLYQPSVMAPLNVPHPQPQPKITQTRQLPLKADAAAPQQPPHIDVVPPMPAQHEEPKAEDHVEPLKPEKAANPNVQAPLPVAPVPETTTAAPPPPVITQAPVAAVPAATTTPIQTPNSVPAQTPPPAPTPTQAQAPVAAAATENLKTRQIPTSMATNAGIPVTPETPNLITGIVKDPRGNSIPNILVEVKDNEKNPVRAFKTNGLGQFASATALPDGVYTIDFEDLHSENKFEAISFVAKGEIILPFEVISTDKREELRRELFN